MKIEIWSDFACPFCYIGKTRFEQALQKFEHKDGVEVTFKAYELNPHAPKKMEGKSYENFSKSHHMTIKEAKDRFKMIEQNAKTVGLHFDFEKVQMTNTFDAHRLAKLAATYKLENEMTTRLMKAYFTEGKNLSEINTLIKIATEMGLDETKTKQVLESDQFKKEVQEQIDDARKVGVQGVPFFVINQKYGISGAQQEEYFTQALNQIWRENNPIQTLNDMDSSLSCEGEDCKF